MNSFVEPSLVQNLIRRRPSITLIRHQAPMLLAWSRVYARSLLPFMRNEANPTRFRAESTLVPMPDSALVSAYAEWCGAGERYADAIPPHMFCQWGMPLALSVVEQSRYDVTGIINQGLKMRVNGELPRGRDLVARAELVDMEEHPDRAVLSVRVCTGTSSQPNLVETVLHTVFMHSPRGGRSGKLKGFRPAAGTEWQPVGSWRACPDDGLDFALLTGDFNPIHWMESAGRKSPFGSTVLQGMGAFARSYECLRRAHTVREIEVQFQRPVLLPSGELAVEFAAESSGWNYLRVVDGDRRARLSGRFR